MLERAKPGADACPGRAANRDHATLRAIDRARAGLLAHRAQSRDGAQGDGYMRVVLVGQVMQYTTCGLAARRDGAQVAGQRPGRVFDLALE